MDPNMRAQVSRPPSTNMQPQGSAPMSNMPQYQMHYPVSQPHTLPPLQQHQNHSPAPPYLGQPYRPEMSRYPTTSASDVYATTGPMPPHTGVGSLPPSSFLTHPSQQQQHFHPHPGMMPPNTTSQSYPQPIAPAPPRDRRPEVGSMPSGAFSHGENKGPVWANADGLPSAAGAFPPKDQPRTQVVGSQGRRGILPSVPGRAAAITNGPNGTTTKNTTIPAKDADGKFPCPHCNKTYLHAKHLKRHLLRHTGDRPYMCVLCKDTFSRSDILKRHFQKCSLRRGNPTGASHLSHPQAHLKRSQAQNVVKPVQDDVSNSIPSSHGIVGTAFGDASVNAGSLAAPNQPRFTEQQPLGFSMSSVNGMGRGHPDNGFTPGQTHQRDSWMAAPKQNPYLLQSGTDAPGQLNVDLPPIEHTKPPLVQDNKRPVMAGGNPNQPGDIDWTSMFQPGAHDGYMNTVFPSSMGHGHEPVNAHVDQERKYYPTSTGAHHQQEGGMNGLYLASTSLGGDGTLGSHPLWNFDVTQNDPSQPKTERLVDFCFPTGIQEPSNLRDSSNLELKECLTADSVKHFLELFTNYQGHWPYLHMPTFDFLEAYDGLIMAVCCVGAVYSDRIAPSHVRDLVKLTKTAVQRTSWIQRLLEKELASDGAVDGGDRTLSCSDIEEIEAIYMLHTLDVWHGDPEQRAAARSQSAVFARFARRFNLLQPLGPEYPSHYSALHNSRSKEPFDLSNWDWLVWVEQEKRSRLLFMLYLSDSAMVIYFNCLPHFNPQEIKLPLPSDDAAWEAKDAETCAKALGLLGSDAQEAVNVTGSRRTKQFEMRHVLSALQSPSIDFQPRMTNVYSKFILIHALHVQIYLVQRQLASPPTAQRGPDSASQVTATKMFNPLPTDSSPAVSMAASSSAPNSNPATPVDSGPTLSGSSTPTQAHVILKSTTKAITKWKRMWDSDMALQYPPATTPSRRFGFCRDAVHFYWLAVAMLSEKHLNDWKLAPDSRFVHMMTLFKAIRSHVQMDSAQRGEWLGSVGDIHEDFDAQNLTLDMKSLFRPIGELSVTEPVKAT